jgi:hypothetical protein
MKINKITRQITASTKQSKVKKSDTSTLVDLDYFMDSKSKISQVSFFKTKI